MAELATIARPYAEALYKAAAGQLDAVSSWLDEVAAISSDPQVQQLAGNPKVTDQQLYDLIAGLHPAFNDRFTGNRISGDNHPGIGRHVGFHDEHILARLPGLLE